MRRDNTYSQVTAAREVAAAPAVVEVDCEGIVVGWSPGAERLFGYAPGEIVGGDVRRLLYDAADVRAMPLQRALCGKTVSRTETVRRASDGRAVPVAVTAHPCFDAHGAVRGATAVYEDLADAPSAPPHDALLRLVLETTQDAYVAMDEEGRVRDWNRSAELLFGWSADEAIGRSLGQTIVPERLRAAHAQGLQRYIAGGDSRIVGRRVELPALHRDGREFPVELTISPLRVGRGWMFAAFLRDLTERTLRRETVERTARLGSWEWELDEDRITYSDSLYDIFGLERGSPVTAKLAAQLVHPLDRYRVHEAMRAALAGESDFDLDFRIRRPDGTLRTLHGRASIVRDGDGRPQRVIGTDVDVSDRAEAEAQARRLAAVVASTADAVVTEDRGGRITSWNAGAERLYGYSAHQAIGRFSGMLVPPDRPGEETTLVARVLAGERLEDFETRRVCKDGAVLDVALTVSPVRDDAGQVVEISTIARDISDRKRAERELRRYADDLEALARQDPVTGLLTPRELHGVLDAELGRADREGGACALILVDAADVRAEDGDDGLLTRLADVVRECAQDGMTAFRAGPDELAVVVPGRMVEHARALADRIVAAWDATRPPAAVTTGVASWPEEGGSRCALVEAARAALPPRSRRSRPDAAPGIRRSALDSADRIVALLRRHLRMEIAYLSEFVGDKQIVRSVDAGPEHPDVSRGDEVPLEGSYCRRMVEGELPGVVADTAADRVTATLDVTCKAGIGCYVGVPVRYADGRLYGSLCCASRAADSELDDTAAHFAHVCARLIGDLIDQRELAHENRRLHGELTGVRALLAALDARDDYTGEHSEAVVRLAGAVARRLRLSPEEVTQIEQVAVLHDIGKIGVPDSILLKAGPLDEVEWRRMREHPAIGAKIVGSIASLAHLAAAVRAEHERWDGRGYPDGLAGETIPLASRVILACDAYHAMTSDRPYRRAMPHADALAELTDAAGTQFDPAVAGALIAELGDWPTAHAPAAQTERTSLLIVEEDSALRLTLQHALENLCFDVETVCDAEAAYRRAVESRPDVVLLDWLLADGVGGPAVCRRLRAIHPDAPIVMHSGLADPRDRRAALEAGAYAFVEKGAPLEQVAALLRSAVAG